MKKSDIYEVTIKILGLYLFFTVIGIIRELLSNFAIFFESKRNPEGYEHLN